MNTKFKQDKSLQTTIWISNSQKQKCCNVLRDILATSDKMTTEGYIAISVLINELETS